VRRLPNLPASPHALLTFLLLCVSSKVRDLSHTSVSIAPADYSSWHDVRQELMSEAKTGFKARVEAELAAANGECLDELKAAFQQVTRSARTATPWPWARPTPNPHPPFAGGARDRARHRPRGPHLLGDDRRLVQRAPSAAR